MENIIKVKIKAAFNMELIYPVNEPAIIFVKLLKKKTLSRSELEMIKQLGFEIKVEETTL